MKMLDTQISLDAGMQVRVRRINNTITASMEKRVVYWLCRRMPASVTSDMLTILGVVGALLSFVSYILSAYSAAFLWLAVIGIAANWLGDSLDGSLARYRRTERPSYGFFLDHTADSFVMAVIALGIGLSPYASLTCALAALATYFLMVILTMTLCVVTGEFRISFYGVGPTEIRLLIMVFTIYTMIFPTGSIVIFGRPAMPWDAILLMMSLSLLTTAFMQFVVALRRLAADDPPRSFH